MNYVETVFIIFLGSLELFQESGCKYPGEEDVKLISIGFQLESQSSGVMQISNRASYFRLDAGMKMPWGREPQLIWIQHEHD